jgi:acyl carrier protein
VSATLLVVTDWLAGLPTGQAPVMADTALIEQGILDSIEILNLVAFLEERFAITLPVEEFVPENFSTPAAIAALVGRLGRQEAA